MCLLFHVGRVTLLVVLSILLLSSFTVLGIEIPDIGASGCVPFDPTTGAPCPECCEPQSGGVENTCLGVCSCVVQNDGEAYECDLQCRAALTDPDPKASCISRLRVEGLSMCSQHCDAFPSPSKKKVELPPEEPFEYVIIAKRTFIRVNPGETASYPFDVKLIKGEPVSVLITLGGVGIFNLVEGNRADWNFNGQQSTEGTPTFSSVLNIVTTDKAVPGVYDLTINGIGEHEDSFEVQLEVLAQEYVPIEPKKEEEKKEKEAPVRAGVITELKGEVLIRRKNGKPTKLTLNTVINQGDTVESKGGTAMITLPDGHKIAVSKNTKVILEKPQEVSLSWGRIKAMFKKMLKGRFAVNTPGAVVAVRGTEFILSYDQTTDESTLHLNEGEVEVTAGGESEIIQAGTSVVVDGGITSTEFSAEEWDALAQEFEEKKASNTIWIILGLFVVVIIFFLIRKRKKK